MCLSVCCELMRGEKLTHNAALISSFPQLRWMELQVSCMFHRWQGFFDCASKACDVKFWLLLGVVYEWVAHNFTGNIQPADLSSFGKHDVDWYTVNDVHMPQPQQDETPQSSHLLIRFICECNIYLTMRVSLWFWAFLPSGTLPRQYIYHVQCKECLRSFWT